MFPTSHARFVCPVIGCNTSFPRQYDCFRHEDEVHGNLKRCPVPGCNWNGSKRKSRLHAHVEKHHEELFNSLGPSLGVPSAAPNDIPQLTPTILKNLTEDIYSPNLIPAASSVSEHSVESGGSSIVTDDEEDLHIEAAVKDATFPKMNFSQPWPNEDVLVVRPVLNDSPSTASRSESMGDKEFPVKYTPQAGLHESRSTSADTVTTQVTDDEESLYDPADGNEKSLGSRDSSHSILEESAKLANAMDKVLGRNREFKNVDPGLAALFEEKSIERVVGEYSAHLLQNPERVDTDFDSSRSRQILDGFTTPLERVIAMANTCPRCQNVATGITENRIQCQNPDCKIWFERVDQTVFQDMTKERYQDSDVQATSQIDTDSSLKQRSESTPENEHLKKSRSAESLQSVADSIFSTTSLSSTSTAPGTNNAFQRIIVIFKTDLVLKEMYQEVISIASAGKFGRNFGTLLKRFALDLEKEANCWNEQRAAQFIRSRARKIAEGISESIYPSIRHESGKPQPPGAEESSGDSEFGDEEDADEFFELERFIVDSNAFQNLRDNIRDFLGLGYGSKIVATELGASQLLAELPFAEQHELGMTDERMYPTRETSSYQQSLWSLTNVHQKFRNLICPEPPVREGFSRVRWKCACGELLYDDYQELRPGAAKRMEDYLRRFSHKTRAQNSKSMTESISSIGVGLKGFVTSITRRFQTKGGQQPVLVNTEPRHYSTRRTNRTPAHAAGDVFYLLLCHNDGIGAEIVKLRQPDVCDINNDQKLFNFLREEYKILRTRWWTWISLWDLQSIKFVRFELYENELVDIKKLDEVPPPTKDNEYRHGPPNPPEENPPIGSAVLMHLFKHPELAGKRSKFLKKIPRKLRNRLAIPNNDEENDTIGWGLQFIEGWSKKRLVYLTALTFGLSSLLVMILVSVLGHNVQNAGAIASFMLSFLTIGIATTQAALHMS